MQDREEAWRELEMRLLELVAEYQRVLREDFLAAREGARYRYAQEAQRDLEEATARYPATGVARGAPSRRRSAAGVGRTRQRKATSKWSAPRRRRILPAPRGWRGRPMRSSPAPGSPSVTAPSSKSRSLGWHVAPWKSLKS